VRKRTALYELTGDQERGPLRITDTRAPSAGDTSYAGSRAPRSRWLTTWYSSPVAEDPSWIVGFADRRTSGARWSPPPSSPALDEGGP
jgi:hypothetical protein